MPGESGETITFHAGPEPHGVRQAGGSAPDDSSPVGEWDHCSVPSLPDENHTPAGQAWRVVIRDSDIVFHRDAERWLDAAGNVTTDIDRVDSIEKGWTVGWKFTLLHYLPMSQDPKDYQTRQYGSAIFIEGKAPEWDETLRAVCEAQLAQAVSVVCSLMQPYPESAFGEYRAL